MIHMDNKQDAIEKLLVLFTVKLFKLCTDVLIHRVTDNFFFHITNRTRVVPWTVCPLDTFEK